jgi:glycosyltransferase involved in cell wall biosynthesis
MGYFFKVIYKNILIVISQVYKMGGAEKIALELAESLENKNIKCAILVLYKDPRNKFYSDNEKVVLNKFKNIHFLGISPNPSISVFLKAIFKVRRILEIYNYNIVETSDLTTSVLISFSKFYLNIKHIFGVHYVYSNKNENNLKFKLWKWILKSQKNIYYYSVSDFAKNSWIKYLDSDSPKIETIKNSIQDSYYNYKTSNHYNLIKDSKVLLYVGRLIEFKGFHKILYSTYDLLLSENLTIVYLGDRDPVTKDHKKDETDRIISSMKNFINKNNLNSRVLFLGFKNNVKDYIKNADLLIHPTKKESFGLVLVESMALGTPIAASNYEAIPEILEETNSILFNPDSEIEIRESVIKFLNLSNSEKKTMIKKGIERSKSFTQDKRTNSMINLYDKIQKFN